MAWLRLSPFEEFLRAPPGFDRRFIVCRAGNLIVAGLNPLCAFFSKKCLSFACPSSRSSSSGGGGGGSSSEPSPASSLSNGRGGGGGGTSSLSSSGNEGGGGGGTSSSWELGASAACAFAAEMISGAITEKSTGSSLRKFVGTYFFAPSFVQVINHPGSFVA